MGGETELDPNPHVVGAGAGPKPYEVKEALRRILV